MGDLSGKTTIVVGASRGLGRGMATAFADAGAPVVAVAPTPSALAVLADANRSIEPEVAGTTPHMRPLQQQTWETFSVNWETDVRIAFQWLREALLKPLRPGSRVVVFSSGAALNASGSPLSGGYAGAKATQRFITAYAQDEATLAGLDITFTAVMPQFAKETGVGGTAVHAYAAGWPLSRDVPRRAAVCPAFPGDRRASLVQLAQADSANVAAAYVLNGSGLQELP